MKRQIGPAILFLLAAAVGARGLIASNMAHIAEVTLYKANDALPEGGSSFDGTNTINLPYDLGPTVVTAKALMNDITAANVQHVARFLRATDTFQIYTGKGTGVNFPLTPGECYYVKMKTSTTKYPVVGSHRPSSLVVPLIAPQAGVSVSGSNFVSLPFNILARNAKELMDDIGFQNVVSVSRFLRSNNTFQTYTGRASGEVAFPISYDECYMIKVSANVNYVPSHY